MDGIRATYLKDGTVDNDTVSALAMALYFGVCEGETALLLAKRLADKVEAGGYKMEAGILGTKALFNALSDYGYSEVCHKMLKIEDYPSYGFWRRLGLLTFPELWEVAEGSRNHHMYADIVHWVYRHVGGIQNLGVAYDRCRISPDIFADKCSAQSYKDTKRGRIAVKWSYEDGVFSAEIDIPQMTCAELCVFGQSIGLSTGNNKIKINAER